MRATTEKTMTKQDMDKDLSIIYDMVGKTVGHQADLFEIMAIYAAAGRLVEARDKALKDLRDAGTSWWYHL